MVRLELHLNFADGLFLQARQRLQKQVQEVDDGAGRLEKLMVFKQGRGNTVNSAADLFLEQFGRGGDSVEQDVRGFEVKQFALDFRVEKNFVGDVRLHLCLVDSRNKPLFADELVDQRKRHHILALEFLTSPHTFLVRFLQPHASQELDHRDEYILGVVLLELPGPFGPHLAGLFLEILSALLFLLTLHL